LTTLRRGGGSPGSYTYSPIAGREALPVVFVSFYDALRFANWLHNGQPTGAQDNSTTEDGAYTITAQGISNNSITRNPGATIFLPSEDEWYKAAYYGALSASYFDYPAGSDTPTIRATYTLATLSEPTINTGIEAVEKDAFPIDLVVRGLFFFLRGGFLGLRALLLFLLFRLHHLQERIVQQLLLEMLLEGEQRHVKQIHRLIQAWIDLELLAELCALIEPGLHFLGCLPRGKPSA